MEEHLQAMKAKGNSTNIAATRNNRQAQNAGVIQSETTASMFENLAFRTKPS